MKRKQIVELANKRLEVGGQLNEVGPLLALGARALPWIVRTAIPAAAGVMGYKYLSSPDEENKSDVNQNVNIQGSDNEGEYTDYRAEKKHLDDLYQDKIDSLKVVTNLDNNPDLNKNIPPVKNDNTIYKQKVIPKTSKEKHKHQSDAEAADSLRLRYFGEEKNSKGIMLSEIIKPSKKLKKDLDTSLKGIRKNNFAISREFNKIDRNKAKKAMSMYKKYIIEYQIRMHKLLREMK